MFQSFGRGRRPMRAKPAKRVAGVGIRFLRSRAAAVGVGPAANDNARPRRFLGRRADFAAGIERLIAQAEREHRRATADRPARAPADAYAEADGRRA